MSWKELLARVQPKDHLVQLYESDDSLTRRVSHYVSEGLELQEGVIAIAAEPHRELLAAQLAKDDVDVERVLGEGRLVLLDAEETLSRFMVEGRPDSELFQESLGSVIDGVRDAGRFRGMRLYGEMVDLLWRDGNPSAAAHLEKLWHELLHRLDLRLLCAYRMDILDRAFRDNAFQSVLTIHSHLVPVAGGDELERAVERAMEDVLGRDRVRALRPLMAATVIPGVAVGAAESAILWVSKALPGECDEILVRARFHYFELTPSPELA